MSSKLEQWIVWYTKEPHMVVEYVLVQALSVSHAEQQFWAMAPGNMFEIRLTGVTLSKQADLYAYDYPHNPVTCDIPVIGKGHVSAVSVMDPAVAPAVGDITTTCEPSTRGVLSQKEVRAIWDW